MSDLYIVSNWGADYPKSWEFAKHWIKHYKDMGADEIIIFFVTKVISLYKVRKLGQLS